MNNNIQIGQRKIGKAYPPFVIAEIGINHEGSMEKARRMVADAKASGAECVKFQTHVIEDEMVPAAQKVVPKHTTDSIWDIMKRCSFTEQQDKELKDYAESLGLIYLSTPFSRAAADRLQRLGVLAYKIGSGECNNYPLVEHISSFGKPVILSTGMNDLNSIRPAVQMLEKAGVPYAVLQCTSLYPTPYNKVNLGALRELSDSFPLAVVGLSDHSLGIYASLGAVALDASIIEKHFTSDSAWPGPDIALSLTPPQLAELIRGAAAVHAALGGSKAVLPEEKPTIDFAYACVVSIKDVRAGEKFTRENIWVKRPGTGQIKAVDFERVLGKTAARVVSKDTQLKHSDIENYA